MATPKVLVALKLTAPHLSGESIVALLLLHEFPCMLNEQKPWQPGKTVYIYMYITYHEILSEQKSEKYPGSQGHIYIHVYCFT